MYVWMDGWDARMYERRLMYVLALWDLEAPPEILERFLASWARFSRNFCAWPSWQQVATKMCQGSGKLAILGSTSEVLGACWEHFGIILAHGLDSRKPTKTFGKHKVLGNLGWLEWGSDSKIWYGRSAGGSCGTFWRPARDSLKVSVQIGAKMGAG